MSDKRIVVISLYVGMGLFLNTLVGIANLLHGAAAHAAPQQEVRVVNTRPMPVYLVTPEGVPLRLNVHGGQAVLSVDPN